MAKKRTIKSQRPKPLPKSAMIRPTSAAAIGVLYRAADLQPVHGSIANAVVQLAAAGSGELQRFAATICRLLEAGDARGSAVDGPVPNGNGSFGMLDEKEKRQFYRAARAIQRSQRL